MIAKKYQDFDVFAVNASNYIGLHWQRLRLDETRKAEMLVAFTRWTAGWYIYFDENRRTPVIIDEIKDAYQDLNRRLKAMIRQIKTDPNLELTAEDQKALGIKPRKTRQIHPIPSEAPEVEFVASEAGKASFILTNTIDGAAGNHKKPALVKRMGIAVVFTEYGMPMPAPSEFKTLQSSGSMRFEIDAPRHKTGYIITWFENHTGEHGPQSAPQQFTVI